MSSVNKVIIVGRLGKDPETKQVSDNTVCNFNVATDESYSKRDGEKVEKTEWHKIVVWGKQAENCSKYLEKGSMVYVEGKLQTRSWDDESGEKKYTTEVVAQTVRFLSTKKSED